LSTADAPRLAAPRVPGPPPHVLVVRAPYYASVIEGMTQGALAILAEAGATHEVLDVAGAFELPQAIGMACRGSAPFDGFVALGCIVRGGTDHYDHICRETMAGLMQVALQTGAALGSGVLTVHSIEQAVARSGADGHNKGAEAAAASLLQIAARRRFGAPV
jgi:6,7-dimethyl-8-ribityllumazine synthase